MKPLTLEWIDKAEGDFATASREWRVRKSISIALVRQILAKPLLKVLIDKTSNSLFKAGINARDSHALCFFNI